jgi:hypothetical protein
MAPKILVLCGDCRKSMKARASGRAYQEPSIQCYSPINLILVAYSQTRPSLPGRHDRAGVSNNAKERERSRYDCR